MTQVAEKRAVRSADAHMSISPEMLIEHLPAKHKDAATEIITKLSESIRNGPGGIKYFTGDKYWPAQGLPGGFDPVQRIKDMDGDGIESEMLYGESRYGGITAENFLTNSDTDLANACISAYNDSLTDWASIAPHRLLPIAAIPVLNIDDAIAEVDRLAKAGFRGIRMPGAPPSLDLDPYWTERWEPLWKRVVDHGLPVHFHLGGGHLQNAYIRSVDPTPKTDPSPSGNMNKVLPPMFTAELVVGTILPPAPLRKYPELKFVFTEAGIGWIPYLLEHMDTQWRRHDWTRQGVIDYPPSEVWYRQCYSTFQEDYTGVELRHRVGVDNMMWANDYPHSDSTWPESAAVVEAMFKDCTPEETYKITRGNAEKLYNLK